MSYTIALIGCGRVGVWLEDDPLRAKPATHMGGIKKIARNGQNPLQLTLTAVCDTDKERLEKCRLRYNVPNAYQDYKKLIQKEKPDIVIIATWTSTHRDIAVFAAKNGVKGIVLEKPVAANLNQARQVIECCKKYDVKLVINHERRWDPLYRKTKEIIDQKTLGNLRFIYGNVLSCSFPMGDWQTVLDEYGGGPLFHDGTHLVDMVRYFAGEIAALNGHISRDIPGAGAETTATAMLQTVSGVNVFLEAGGLRNYFNFELDLQFENGRIKVGNGIHEYYESTSSKMYTGFHDLTRKEFPSLDRSTDPFTGAILEVLRTIDDGGEPDSSGADGLKALEIIFAVYHSASLNGKPVSLPLKLRGHPLKKIFSNS